MDKFEEIKNQAIEVKSALFDDLAEKTKIEEDFVKVVKERQDAITAAEQENDPNKADALNKTKSDFAEYQKDFTTEMKALLAEENKDLEPEKEEKSDELSSLGAEINNGTTIDLTTLSGKSRPELWQTPGYISKIQEIILQTGAKHENIQEDKLKNGIFGPEVKAGVKTIQVYLNTTYASNLVSDGIPGPMTLSALLSPVSETDTTSRLDEMLAEKPTFTKIFEITQNESNTNTTSTDNNTAQENTGDNNVETVETKVEISKESIYKKAQELKKKFPTFIEAQKKIDKDFLWNRAKAILDNGEERIKYQEAQKKRYKEGKTTAPEKLSDKKDNILKKTKELKAKYPKFIEAQKKTDKDFLWNRAKAILDKGEERIKYQEIMKKRYENKKTTVPEKLSDKKDNILKKTKELKAKYPKFIEAQKKTDKDFLWNRAKAILDKGEERIKYQEIMKKRYKENKNTPSGNVENLTNNSTLDEDILEIAHQDIKYKLINYMKQNPITFTGKNAWHYKKYYEDNIMNLEKHTLEIVGVGSNDIIVQIYGNEGFKYYIDLKPNDYLEKVSYKVNFNTILNAIKNDIIKKSNIEIKKEENIKLRKKYETLRNYLEENAFNIDYLYTKEEQVPRVKAFFKNFPYGIGFSTGHSQFLEESKKIKANLSDGAWDTYGTSELFIEDKLNEDGTLNKAKIKQAVRDMVDRKIKEAYPTYQINQ